MPSKMTPQTLQQGRGVLVIILHGLISIFNSTYGTLLKPLTVRDIKSSIPFFASNIVSYSQLDRSLIHDYVNLLLGGFRCQDKILAEAAIQQVLAFADATFLKFFPHSMIAEPIDEKCSESDTEFKIGRYTVEKALTGVHYEDPKYSVQESVVRSNLKIILQGLSLDKAIMLEGPPGVGKTSLIQFLARKVGVKFYRVNLNEQTDMIDLLGSDVPSASSSIFSWADGILIQAMKEGAWLLLDELNMATQTVLEGLNSILDHRGSIYLPELDTTIVKHRKFRIFASQNPLSMGSGRKGLPHSFLTRFTRAWIEELPKESLKDIIRKVYPQTMERDEMGKIVSYFFAVKQALQVPAEGVGIRHYEPQWEFNLRDLHKIIDFVAMLSTNSPDLPMVTIIQQACQAIILDRIDDESTKVHLRQLFTQVFGSSTTYSQPLQNLKASHTILPQYLDGKNAELITDLLSEPLVSNLTRVIQTAHPVLFLYDSRSDSSVCRIEQVIYSLAKKNHTKPQIRLISLFSSSDLIDIIGSYEQANPTQVFQRSATTSLIGHLKQDKPFIGTDVGTIKLALTDCFATGTANPSGGSLFTWQESELCAAIRKGDWVIIKGAELVNPAILERLNGLLEEKEVFINEALGAGKDIELLVKHDSFRVFIMYDLAKAKQVPSRALRNRCIEINMHNYDLPGGQYSSLPTPATSEDVGSIHLNKLVQKVVKYTVDRLDATDETLASCERFVTLERLRCTYDIFALHYKKFITSEIKTWDLHSYQRVADTINSLVNEIVKNVHYRRNYSFPPIQSIDPAISQSSKPPVYLASELLSNAVGSLLSNLITSELTMPIGGLGSICLASSSASLASKWSNVAMVLLRENTRDDIEEGCRMVAESSHDSIRRLAILCASTLEGKSKLAARWAPALFEVLRKYDTNLDRDTSPMLAEAPRSPVKLVMPESRIIKSDNGFVSPVSLSLNILFNFLITKSIKAASVLEATADSNSKSTQLWSQICKVLNRQAVLKFKIASKATGDNSLVRMMEAAVKTSLGRKTILEENVLSEILKMIESSVESTFADVIKTVESMFLDYDLLEEETNLMQDRLVFKSNPSKINAFIGLLSKNKYFRELCPSDRVAKISDYIHENFEASSLLLNQVENIEKDFGKYKLIHSLKHIEALSAFFGVDQAQTKAVRYLLADYNTREIKRLATMIASVRFDEFKLSDVNILESIEQKLEKQATLEVPLIYPPEDSDEILADVVDGEPQLLPSICLLEEICKYAENPNLNTFLSLMDSLSTVVNVEDMILRRRIAGVASRKFSSVLDNADGLRAIHDCLTIISTQLRSQKTRHVSKHQFESDASAEVVKDHTLSFFVANNIFRLLSKSSSFLQDAEVQEMKKIVRFCRLASQEWRRVQFEDLEGMIRDSQNLLLSFLKCGQLVTFGDFLLPFFGKLTVVLYTLRHHLVNMPNSPAGIVSFDHLTPLRASILPSLTNHHPASLLASASIFLSLAAPLRSLERMIESNFPRNKRYSKRNKDWLKAGHSTRLVACATFREA